MQSQPPARACLSNSEIRNVLSEELLSATSPQAMAEIERHLSNCTACRIRLVQHAGESESVPAKRLKNHVPESDALIKIIDLMTDYLS